MMPVKVELTMLPMEARPVCGVLKSAVRSVTSRSACQDGLRVARGSAVVP